MVAFYVDKIKNKIMNPDTKQAWKLEDVPNLWRKKTEKALADYDCSIHNIKCGKGTWERLLR